MNSYNWQVSNAQEELIQWYESHNFVNNIYHASERCAGGIIQALEHYDFGPYNPPRKRIKDNQFPDAEPELPSGKLLDNGSAKREVIEFNVFLEMWLCGHIPDNDKYYKRVVEVIVSSLISYSEAEVHLSPSHSVLDAHSYEHTLISWYS